MEPDFAGYVTKAGLKCSDGRTIMPDAFKHMDGMTVPLVWQHGKEDPENILGHAVLEAREDGMYGRGYFNETPKGQHMKAAVQHKDIRHMSIYANQLIERSKQVFHGLINEVSLVLNGANPGALIDFVRIAHADGSVDTLENEAIIYTGLEFSHGDSDNSENAEDAGVEHASGDTTVQDVLDGMTEEQMDVLHFMVGSALEEAAAGSLKQSADSNDSESEDSGDSGSDEGDLEHQEGNQMKNVFEDNGATGQAERPTLTREQIQTLIHDAEKCGSYREAFLSHADEYGITNIDILFPEARMVNGATPEWISRPMEWVTTFLGGAHKSPFSRIKSMSADITWDEARAKGYVKGNQKKEEFFAIAKRVTNPFTVYKKQKLDRDDVIDITDFDVVAWIKAEMKVMLNEEVARAGLVGDGREVDDPDKISETQIRPIAYDDDFYTYKHIIAASVTGDSVVDEFVKLRKQYKGSGNPTAFVTEDLLTELLLVKDLQGHRLYKTEAELAAACRVSSFVEVPVLEDRVYGTARILAVLVNLSDYTYGADDGGKIGMFDDFDIDFNQMKYLIETRCSGALTKYHSAVTLARTLASGVVTPNAPTFVSSTGVVTIVATTNVVYKNAETGATLSTGAQTALASGASVRIKAVPATGYAVANNEQDAWLFTRD